MAEKNIIYNEEGHSYFYGDKKLRSVTEIASEICSLNKTFFKKGSAEIGTAVHNELARYYDPKEEFEATDFKEKLSADIAIQLKRQDAFRTEIIVHNLEHEYAGTIDLLSVVGNKVTLILDFKTGNVNRKYCTVQLSLYKLALESMGYDCSEATTVILSPSGYTKIDCLSWEDVWNLQKSALDPIDKDELDRIEARMTMLEPMYNEYKELEQLFRTKVLDQLESAGATNYFGNKFNVSYVKPSTRISLDTSRLRSEMPDVYQKYTKETKVSGSVKLTNKGNDNE